MNHTRLTQKISWLVFALAVCMQPVAAFAESAIWNYGVPYTLYSQHYGDQYFSMSGIQVQVANYATARNASTGQSICGASIPVGTRVNFDFVPHDYTHIYWFGSGYANDSPYGAWIPGGARDSYLCQDKYFAYYQPAWRWSPRNHYIDLSIHPPTRSVTAPSMFSCEGARGDGSVTCTAQSAGSGTALFTIGATYGYFHKALIGDGEDACFNDEADLYIPGQGTYQLNVPQQTISCPVQVLVPNHTPTAPTVTIAAPSGTTVAGGACVAGTPYTLAFVSTDPQGKQLRYGIDWDNRGGIDQWVPASGYVHSGVPQTASRTFAVAGAKTVRVLAENSEGLPSGWTTITFTCAASPAQATNDFSAAKADSGISNAGVGARADLVLAALPSLVRSGDSTKVNWSATNVTSCVVTSTNGDRWTTVFSDIGGNPSRPIRGKTIYTLSCLDLHKDPVLPITAEVNVIPAFQER